MVAPAARRVRRSPRIYGCAAPPGLPHPARDRAPARATRGARARPRPAARRARARPAGAALASAFAKTALVSCSSPRSPSSTSSRVRRRRGGGERADDDPLHVGVRRPAARVAESRSALCSSSACRWCSIQKPASSLADGAGRERADRRRRTPGRPRPRARRGARAPRRAAGASIVLLPTAKLGAHRPFHTSRKGAPVCRPRGRRPGRPRLRAFRGRRSGAPSPPCPGSTPSRSSRTTPRARALRRGVPAPEAPAGAQPPRGRFRSRREYPIDVIDRPTLDAVAVCLWARTPRGVEVLTRRGLRPAAYFRRGKTPALPEREYLLVEEIVAGVLEPGERGLDALRRRGAAEAREEAGVEIAPERLVPLGGPFFPLPGIVSEKIHLLAGEVERGAVDGPHDAPTRATARRSRRGRCSSGAASRPPSRRARRARSRTRRPRSPSGGSPSASREARPPTGAAGRARVRFR